MGFHYLLQCLTHMWSLKLWSLVLRSTFYLCAYLGTEFWASTAKVLSIAIWARLSELPPEFYNCDILCQVGNKLGHTLKIDASTNDLRRGIDLRLRIQMSLNQPLKTCIFIDHHRQQIIYEGINQVCFQCGCVGHKNYSCPQLLPLQPLSPDQTLTPLSSSPITTKVDPPSGPGPWMVVQHNSQFLKPYSNIQSNKSQY